MVTVHVAPETVLQPVHPVRTEPEAAIAVSVTTVPLVYGSAQSAPQLIPAGLEVTVPTPLPDRATARGNVSRSKRAPMDVFAAIVTAHVPVPAQPPPVHPAKSELTPGAAVSVTTVPPGYVSEQSVPQLTPAGLEPTLPVPAPVLATPREKVINSNRAATVVAAAILTTHAPAPVQPPPVHPAKNDPVPGAADSVTDVLLTYVSVQSVPQLIPAGLEVTAPVPPPVRLTVNGKVIRSKRALIVVSAVRVMLQFPVPAQPPPVQPPNNDPLSGVDVKVMAVPVGWVSAQSVPQLIPAGLEVTVPPPVPRVATESVLTSVTVSVVLAVLPASSATVIVVVPRAIPVALPPPSMLATAGLLLVQVRPNPLTATGVVESVVVPFPSCP
jgi:hypothetical protein